MGTVGVVPQMKEPVLRRFAAAGIPVPAHKGFDTLECMDAAAAGKMRVAVCLGGNLFGSNPDAAYAREALSKVDLVVYLSTSLNTGHAHGLGKRTLILPVLARDEEPYLSSQESMFNYVRVSDGGPARHAGPRGEVAIIADLGTRILDDGRAATVSWGQMHDAGAIREWIARLIPGMEAAREVSAAKKEFTIPGRVLHDGVFPTPGGKARFMAHPLPGKSKAPFQLMTVRSEGQFNTVVYEEHDYYRGQERRDVVLMAPEDMQRLGIAADELVAVSNFVGRMTVRARPFDIKPGSALMYYPEANVLVPRKIDGQSRTPAFKAAPVDIVRLGGAGGTAEKPPGFWRHHLRKALRPQPKSC
jgi:anaerobic selenocysteine-containing dehydrogenase